MLTALFVSGLFFVFRPQLLQASNLNSAKFPHYKIEVSYDHDKTLLVGKMQVRFSRKAYPHDELLFALPGNRFLVPDERGIRKHKIVPVFSLSRFQDNLEDPKTPTGFSPGNLEIKSVNFFDPQSATAQHQLAYKLEENPDLEVGYSTSRDSYGFSCRRIFQTHKAFPESQQFNSNFQLSSQNMLRKARSTVCY